MIDFAVGTHNERFHSLIDGMWAQEKRAKMSGMAGVKGSLRYEYAENRRINSDRIVESFFAIVGQLPSTAQLDRLASYLLFDELTDDTPYKTQNEEYPIESEHKAKRYYDKLTSRPVPETMATDGKDYRVPYRRSKTRYENELADRAWAGESGEVVNSCGTTLQ